MKNRSLLCYVFHAFYLLNFLPNDKSFNLSKLKAFADDEEKCDSKTEICFGRGRKHCGKRRKCWLPAFSQFPTKFSKGYFLRVFKSPDCVVKGLVTSITDYILINTQQDDNFIFRVCILFLTPSHDALCDPSQEV